MIFLTVNPALHSSCTAPLLNTDHSLVHKWNNELKNLLTHMLNKTEYKITAWQRSISRQIHYSSDHTYIHVHNQLSLKFTQLKMSGYTICSFHISNKVSHNATCVQMRLKTFHRHSFTYPIPGRVGSHYNGGVDRNCFIWKVDGLKFDGMELMQF